MDFVIEETSLQFHGLSYEQIGSSLSACAELIRSCREDGRVVWCSENIYVQKVFDRCQLFELLFDHRFSSNLDRDDLEFFRIEIERSSVWEKQNSIDDHNVIIGQDEIIAPSIAFAANRSTTATETACVVSNVSSLAGPTSVSHTGRTVVLSFVSSGNEKINFYRQCLDREARSETEYMAVAPLAFPDLIFADELASQFRRFREPYLTIRIKVTRHLSALNDQLPNLLGLPPSEIQARMGIDLSLESPQTHQNQRAMRDRRVIVRGTEIVCEWHTKISPTFDRIHFHCGLPELGGKPIIGLFVDHLAT